MHRCIIGDCTSATTPKTAPEAVTDSGNCVGVDCGEHGRCESVNETHTACVCLDYYDGPRCEQFKPIEYAARFDGKAFIVFSADEFPHLTSEKEETIELKFKTTATDGVILWQGQQPETPIGGEDYVSIGLDDGYLVYSYELGGGAAQITSKDPVNDDQEHTIKLTRKGRSGKMFLDGKEAITGSSSGILAMLNVEGNIYLGGLPNLELMTGGLHQKNFVGCVADLTLNGEKMDFMANAVDGRNVRPCDEWEKTRRYWVRRWKL
uniref:Basement membrane-specific heparan sulfate proteoglycan core protein n=1 Tax=Plectus sambesii TaxID=2011161 RepID=A0A914WFZ4_9BILA